ncbi:MAG: T9SS type A sorting domain-containing protein, partial [Chitinophagaceae bacterium]
LFQNLQAGTYKLYIRDTAGCINSVSPVVVANASGLTIAGTTVISSCAANTGQIILSGSGGTSPYTYSIDSINYQNSGTFTGLASGSYTARIKDVNGCISRITLIVSKQQGPTISVSVSTATCNNANGKIFVTASSGTSPYLYSRNGTTFQSSSTFKAVAQGTYTVTVKDSNLCTATATATIGNIGSTTGPTVTATTLDAECGQSTGKINGNGSGGKNPKKYSINGVNYQGSTNFNDIPPGNYTLYVMDDNGCTNEVSVTVGNVTGPQVTAVDTPTTCGNSVGAIVCTGSNGVAPYKYSIDNGVNFQNSNTFTGLSAGFYTVVVRDNANVCKNSIVVKITNSNGPVITLTKNNATCGANNGKITASVSGGTGTKTYSLDGINFQSSNVFNGLPAGDYAVYAKDSLGCVNSATISVSSIASPAIRLTQVSETCGQNNGKITAFASGGTAPYQYQLDTLGFVKSTIFSGLNAGTYKVTLKDTNLCVVSANITIAEIAGPKISSRQYPVSCNSNNGTVLSTGRDGTMQYQYNINGSAYGQSFLFDHLSAGTKIIGIKDSNNCLAYDTIVVNSRTLPVVSLTEDTSGCAPGRGSIVVNVSGGTAPYLYSTDSITFQNSNRFNCLLSGTYSVYIKDSTLCQDNNSIQITGVALLVNLIDFNAEPLADKVYCRWSTSEEINSGFFIISRSLDAQHWETVGIIPASGNSNSVNQYLLEDASPHYGSSYYRLIESDSKGKKTELGIRQVYIGEGNQIKAEPNPANEYFLLEGSGNNATISIQTVEGYEIHYDTEVVGDALKINTKQWQEGVYIITVVRNGKMKQLKLVIVHD